MASKDNNTLSADQPSHFKSSCMALLQNSDTVLGEAPKLSVSGSELVVKIITVPA